MTTAPLMRLTLIRTAERRHELLWSYHQLLLDGWSMSLVIDDMAAIYQAITQGRDHRLPAPRPYRDYIAWLRQQDMAKAEAFWRDTLAGFSAPTVLPVDRGAGNRTGQHEDAGEQWQSWSLEASSALRSFASRNGLTLSTVFHGAWAILLSRYSGEDDVLFGSVTSGRPAALAGAESMVGHFSHPLPMRTAVPPKGTVVPWLMGL